MLWQTVIYFVYNVLLNQSPAGYRVHLQGGWHASTHSAQRTELAVGQLSRFHHKKQWPQNFAKYKPSGLSRVMCNVGGLPQAYNKAENNRWAQGITSGYLGQPITRTHRQDGERLLKLNDWRLVLELGAVSGHFEHSQWQWKSGI